MNTLERNKKFWQNQTSPLHRYDTKEHYQQYAAELKILFNNKIPETVLEIGCGNGALYEYLGFNHVHHYKGIDFSPAMLKVFEKNYPDVELECCDGSAYCDDRKYDLIFSNGLIQDFDSDMLHRYFTNVKKMMHQDSLFVCASVPWKFQKLKYITGQFTEQNKFNIFKGYLYYFKTFFKDPMGIWYNLSDISKMSQMQNMSVEFYASMHYMYRFHAVMKLKN